MLDLQRLDNILGSLKDARIAVVGDLFLDRYFDLDSTLTEPSVETGLDADQVFRVRCYPGAAGTVLNNLSALGVGHLSTLSVIGNDGEAFELMCALDRLEIDTEHVIQAGDRMTPTYSKPMLSQPDGSFFDNANTYTELQVRGTCIWLLPAGVRFDGKLRITRYGSSGSDHDLVIVAGPTAA